MIEKKEISRLNLVHIGKILANFCIFGTVFLLLTGFIPVMYFLWLVVAGLFVAVVALIWMCTLFLAPIPLGEIADGLFGNSDIMLIAYKWLAELAPYVFAITAVCAIVSIVMIAVFDRYKRKGRIIMSSIMLGLSVIGMIFIYVVIPGVLGGL